MKIPYSYVNGVLVSSYAQGMSIYSKPYNTPLFNLQDTVDFTNYVISQNHFSIVTKLFDRDKEYYRRMYTSMKTGRVDTEALFQCLKYYYEDMYRAVRNVILDKINACYFSEETSGYFDSDKGEFSESLFYLNKFENFTIGTDYNWKEDSLLSYKFDKKVIQKNLSVLINNSGEDMSLIEDTYVDYILSFPAKYTKYLKVDDSLVYGFIFFVMMKQNGCFHTI